MKSKNKRILVKSLAFLIPSTVVGGIVTATIKGSEQSADPNDPNRRSLEEIRKDSLGQSVFEPTKEAIARLGDNQEMSENRMNTVYKFDSSLSTRLVFSSDKSQLEVPGTNTKASIEAQKKIDDLIKELLDKGISIDDLAILLASWRVDYEDSFNIDTRSWTDFIAAKYITVIPDEFRTAEIFRTIKRLYRFIKFAHSIVDTYVTTPLGEYIFAEALKVIKKPKTTFSVKRTSKIYSSAIARAKANWHVASSFSEVDAGTVRVDVDSKSILTRLKQDKAANKLPEIESDDWWNDRERLAYEKAAADQPWTKEKGMFFDPSHKPSTIADFLEKNDIISKIKSGDVDVIESVLEEMDRQFAGGSVNSIGVFKTTQLERVYTPDDTETIKSLLKKEAQLERRFRTKLDKKTYGEVSKELAETITERVAIQTNKVVLSPLPLPQSGAFKTTLNELKNEINKLSNTLKNAEFNKPEFVKGVYSSIDQLGIAPKAAQNLKAGIKKLEAAKDAISAVKVTNQVEFVYASKDFLKQLDEYRKTVGAPPTKETQDKLRRMLKMRISPNPIANNIHVLSKANQDLLREAEAELKKGILSDPEINKLVADERTKLVRSTNLSPGEIETRLKTLRRNLDYYKLDVQKKYESFLGSVVKLRQAQDVFDRAKRRDSIFRIYGELKKNIQEVGDFNELALLFEKFQSDLAGLEGGEALRKNKRLAFLEAHPDNSLFKLNDAVKQSLESKHFDDSPLKDLSFKNANKVDISKITLLQDELNRFVNKVSTNIREIGKVMGNYSDNVKSASVKFNAYLVDYDEAVQELLDITKTTESPFYKSGLKQLNEKYLDHIKRDPIVSNYLTLFYENGKTQISNSFLTMQYMEDMRKVQKVASENATFALDEIDKAGKTLTQRFNTVTSVKIEEAQKALDVLNKQLNDGKELVRDITNPKVIDLQLSPGSETFKANLDNAFKNLLIVENEGGVFNRTFENEFFNKLLGNASLLGDEATVKSLARLEKDRQAVLSTTRTVASTEGLLGAFEKIGIQKIGDTSLKDLEEGISLQTMEDIQKDMDQVILAAESDLERAKIQSKKALEAVDDQIDKVKEVLNTYNQRFGAFTGEELQRKYIYVDVNSDLGQVLRAQTERILSNQENLDLNGDLLEDMKRNLKEGYFQIDTLKAAEANLEATQNKIKGASDLLFENNGKVQEYITDLENIKNEYKNSLAEAKQKLVNGEFVSALDENIYKAKMYKARQNYFDFLDVRETYLGEGYKNYNKEIQNAGDLNILNGKGEVIDTAKIEAEKFDDTKTRRKMSSLPEPSVDYKEVTYFERVKELRAEANADAVKDFIARAGEVDPRTKMLRSLDVLEKQATLFAESTDAILDWGRRNLSTLMSRRNFEVMKYNKELTKLNPDRQVLKQLAEVIFDMNKKVLERQLALASIEGINADEVDEIFRKNTASFRVGADELSLTAQEVDETMTRLRSSFYGEKTGDQAGETLNLQKQLTEDDYVRIFGENQPIVSTQATSQRFTNKLEQVRVEIDELKQFITTADVQNLPNLEEYTARRNSLASKIQELQVAGGEISSTALGTFRDVDTYSQSRWYAQGTDVNSAGEIIFKAPSSSTVQTYREIQSRFASMETVADNFVDTLQLMDDVVLEKVPTEAAQKFSKQVGKTDNLIRKGVEIAKIKDVKLNRTASFYAWATKFQNSAYKLGEKLDVLTLNHLIVRGLEKAGVKSARRISETVFEFSLSSVLDIGGTVIDLLGKGIFKGVSKVVSKVVEKLNGDTLNLLKQERELKKLANVDTTDGVNDADDLRKALDETKNPKFQNFKEGSDLKKLGLSDEVVSSYDTLLDTQKQVAKWDDALKKTEETINKLEDAIKKGKKAGADITRLLTDLDNYKSNLKTLKASVANAKSISADATDAFKKSLETTFDSTRKRLRETLTTLEEADDAKNARKLKFARKRLEEFDELADKVQDASSFTKKLKILKSSGRAGKRVASDVEKILQFDMNRLIDHASDALDKTKEIFYDTQNAYDKMSETIRKARKANKLSQDIIDNLDVLRDSVRLARQNAKAGIETLYAVRKTKIQLQYSSKFAQNFKLASAWLKKIFASVKPFLRSAKAFRALSKGIAAAIKVVKAFGKLASKIPFIGEAIEVIMFGVSVYFLIERQKQHDKTVAWNEDAKKWREEYELNPWAETPTGNKEWDKYHPWAIGALPRLLNLGYQYDLRFYENIKNVDEHPFLNCEGGDGVPTGKFEYNLISEYYKQDYDRVYGTELYTEIDVESPMDYMDLIDPVSSIGNLIVSGSPVTEEVQDELRTDTISGFLLEHKVWTPTNQTRFEDSYTYPVVNKDCYFFMGKYAPVKDKDAGDNKFDRVGLYRVSSKTRKKLIDEEGADPTTIERLEKKGPDTYFAASAASFEFESLKEAADFYYDNNPESFVIKKRIENYEDYARKYAKSDAKFEEESYGGGLLFTKNDYYTYFLQHNLDPDKEIPDNISDYEYFERGAPSKTTWYKKVKELTKEEFYKYVSTFYIKYDNDPRTYFMNGAFNKLNASTPYNTMEDEGVNPIKFRNFRYIYTDKGQEYIDKKTEEIIYYNIEQIALTLRDIRKKLISKLSLNKEFTARLEGILSLNNNGVKKRLTPTGVKNIIKSLEKSKALNLLFGVNWDLHLNDFKYWQVKENPIYSITDAEGQNVATTHFTNKALLLDSDPRNTHDWDALISKNIDDLVSQISSSLYTTSPDGTISIVDITELANEDRETELLQSLVIIKGINERKVNANQHTIRKKAIEVAAKYGVSAEYDPLKLIPYSVAKATQLLGILTLPNDSQLEQILNVIISERMKFLLIDLRPEADLDSKMSQAKTVKELHEVVKEWMDNATETQRKTNFYYLAQMLMQTYNWNTSDEDDLDGSRTDYQEEMLVKTGIKDGDNPKDKELIDTIIRRLKKENIQLSDSQLQLLYSTRDPLRFFVTDWISDKGIYQTADDFVKSINQYRDEANYSDTFAVKYVDNQRFQRAGKDSFVAQQWGDLNKVDDGSDLKVAAPGPTRLFALSKYYREIKSQLDSASSTNPDELKAIYTTFKDFQDDVFETQSLRQEAEELNYIDKALDAAWDNIIGILKEDSKEGGKGTFFSLNPDNFNVAEKREEILGELKKTWSSDFASVLHESRTRLNELWSNFDNQKDEFVKIGDYVNAKSEVEIRNMFKGRDKKTAERRIGYFDFISDYLAKVIDFGTVYPDVVRNLKLDIYNDVTDSLDVVPILTPYGLILQKIRELALKDLHDEITNIFIDQFGLIIRENVNESALMFLDTLKKNINFIGYSGSEIPNKIVVTYPRGNEETLNDVKSWKDLPDNPEIVPWMIAWIQDIRTSNEVREEVLTNGIGNSAVSAVLDLSDQVAKDRELYEKIEEFYSRPNVVPPTSEDYKNFYQVSLAPSEDVDERYKAQNVDSLTTLEEKRAKAYWYIQRAVNVESALKIVPDADGGGAAIVVGDTLTINDYKEIPDKFDDMKGVFRSFYKKELKKLGINILSETDAEKIAKKMRERKVFLSTYSERDPNSFNGYMDFTFTAFLNRFRRDALEQNTKINNVIEKVAREEIIKLHNNLPAAQKEDQLYFRMDHLDKAVIEYIWIDQSKRDEVKFEENLKKYIINYSQLNIIADKIVNLSVWKATKDAWIAELIKDLLAGNVDETVTPFMQSNVDEFIREQLKPMLQDWMKNIYGAIKEDTLDYVGVEGKGVDAFNNIIEAMGRLNNELNNLLIKKLISIFGLELTTSTIASAQVILPLFFDASLDDQIDVLKDSIGRDLSPLLGLNDYVSDSEGNNLIPVDDLVNYVISIDTRFKSFINDLFQDYMDTKGTERYYKLDRNKLYHDLLLEVRTAYKRYVLPNMTQENLQSILSGEIFIEGIKNHFSIEAGRLNTIFSEAISGIDLSIGNTSPATDDFWHEYVENELFPKDIQKTFLNPTAEETAWFYTRSGVPAINLLLNISIDEAISNYNANQPTDADGNKYSVNKKDLTTNELQLITKDLLLTSLNSFTELLRRATAEHDSSILPDVDQYAYTIMNNFYNDVKTKSTWQGAIDNHKYRDISLQEALKDFIEYNQLQEKEVLQFQLEGLYSLERMMFASDSAKKAITKETLEALYTGYIKYLDFFN